MQTSTYFKAKWSLTLAAAQVRPLSTFVFIPFALLSTILPLDCGSAASLVAILTSGGNAGILSMFCAKAGASKVLAVDQSAIIGKARENVFNNGLSSVIICLKGTIEDVTLPIDRVDIIVSEWMGYCLLYEAMLPSVLYARDKYLKPDGLLIPSLATLWIAPIEDPQYISDYVSYWRDVYGFDMKAMQESIYNEVCIQTMPAASVCGDAFPFKILDLRYARKEDLVFTTGWTSRLNRHVDQIDGFLIWFDIFFATSWNEELPEHITPEAWRNRKQGNAAFTTGPYGTETHWRHGLILAAPPDSPITLPETSHLVGEITFSAPEPNSRALVIDASWSILGRERSQSWELI